MKIKSISALLAATSLSLTSQASTLVWDGNGGSSAAWFTANNWDTNTLPGTADLVQFPSFTSVATTVTINFGSGSVNNGTGNEAVGAIEATSARTNSLTFNNSSSSVVGTLTLNGAIVNSVSDVVLRNNSSITLTLNATGSGSPAQAMGVALGDATNNIVRIDGSGGISISSIISDASGNKKLTLDGSGTGTLTLSGANTYSGGTTLAATTLKLGSAVAGSASALGNTANTLTVNGGTLDMASFSQTVGQLTGTGGSITNNTSSTTSTLTVSGTDTSASAYAGTIVDGGSGKIVALVRSGTGKTILSGANTFTGGTSISGGTLVLGSATTLQSATGTITASGGTLSSSVASTTIGGNLVLSGGTIDPNGTGIGTIILGASKTFTMSSGTLNIKLGTSFDQITGGAGSTFSITGGTLALDVSGAGFSYASTYQILTSFTGTSNPVSGLTITGISGYTATLDGSGLLSFTASPVPEPSTYAAIFGALVLTGVIIRRRKTGTDKAV